MSLANALHVSMKAVYDERDMYPTNLEETGFNPVGKVNCSFYLKSEDIPEGLKPSINTELLPFNNTKSYQVLVACPVSEYEMRLITVNDAKGVELKESIKAIR